MATKNIVPRATGEGSLGTADKKWAGVYANEVTVNGIALTSKLASIDSSVGGKVDTSTYNTKMTSLDSSISELSSGKANDNEVLHLTGDTMTGNINFASGDFAISRSTGDGTNFDIGWKYVNSKGGGISFRSASHSTQAGAFNIYAKDGTNTSHLLGTPEGTLTWNGEYIHYGNSARDGQWGWVKFRNNLVIGWGVVTNNSTSGTTVGFPVTFTSNPTVIVNIAQQSNLTSAYNVYGMSVTTTNFKIIVHNGTALTSDGVQCSFIVIGEKA